MCAEYCSVRMCAARTWNAKAASISFGNSRIILIALPLVLPSAERIATEICRTSNFNPAAPRSWGGSLFSRLLAENGFAFGLPNLAGGLQRVDRSLNAISTVRAMLARCH